MSIAQTLHSLLDRASHANQVANEKRNIRRAVRELQSLSDRELHDLGIGRGTIKHAVMHGRDNEQDKAA